MRRSLRAFGVAATLLAGLTLATTPASAEPTPQIIGGSDASTTDNPWMVALANPSSLDNGRSGQFCGGTLVAARKVVTAAHCVVGKSPAGIRVIIGRTDLTSKVGTVLALTKLWVHPRFQGTSTGSDVAVLTLASDAPGRPLPVGVPADNLYQPGHEGLLLGWGKIGNTAGTTHLKQAHLPVVSDQRCGQVYSEYDGTAMVCAGSATARQCNGDSGGPYVVNGKLAGIVSFSKKPCDPVTVPGVLTRVATYSTLIAQQVNG